MTVLLAATTAVSVFAAGSTVSTTSTVRTPFGRHGSHAETTAQKSERQLAMATALANALGTSVDTITAQLQAGKKPQDIIKASGMDETTIKAQLDASHEADMKAHLTADVTSGKLTQAQADQMLTDMTTHKKGGHFGDMRGNKVDSRTTASIN